MDFAFSEREQMLRKTVREFAENEVTPKMGAMEENGKFPMELLQPMAELGIMGVITPPEYDGVGLGYVARTIVLEELGRVCGAMPMAVKRSPRLSRKPCPSPSNSSMMVRSWRTSRWAMMSTCFLFPHPNGTNWMAGDTSARAATTSHKIRTRDG